MTKDNISDFIEAWKLYDLNPDVPNQSGSTWSHRFEEAGYHEVEMPWKGYANLEDAAKWCHDTIGKENYAYISTFSGYSFWFQTEQDAVLFSLRWL